MHRAQALMDDFVLKCKFNFDRWGQTDAHKKKKKKEIAVSKPKA